MGFVLILPWLIGFCIFKLYPFVSSLVYSFTDYDLFRGVQNVVGFQNYIDAFTKAKNVKALKVTFTYAFMTVPLKLIFALFIAYILNFKIKGVGLFRTAYYVPSILGGSVAIAVLWKALFKNDGVVNTILTMLGFELKHVGVNCKDEAEAEKVAGAFESLFGFARKKGNSSVFAGTALEAMKSPYLGEKGHIAIGTNSVKRAIHYLEGQGYEFDYSTAKYKGDQINAIYLKKEVGGFAVHLVQKA